jgi:hypothetical protein
MLTAEKRRVEASVSWSVPLSYNERTLCDKFSSSADIPLVDVVADAEDGRAGLARRDLLFDIPR